jgi:uncharacterized protein (DUF1499 family)
MSRKTILLLGLMIIVVVCAVPIGYGFNRYKEYASKSEQALENIAGQLGTEHDWESVQLEIYCHILRDKVALNEIKEELTGVTTIEIVRDDDEYLYFTLYFTDPYVKIDDVGLTFNEDFQLIEKFRRVGLGGSDMAPIKCLE